MKKAIVFDIDGTLADNSHRLHYIQGEKKDWNAFYDACAEDKPTEEFLGFVRLLSKGIYEDGTDECAIVICTGRPEQIREITERWFWKNFWFHPKPMYMRKDGDHRPDYEVKEEMIAQMRADGYEPILAIEDRKQVVDMWRRNGIRCLQCAEGDY